MILLSGQLHFPVTQGLSLIGLIDTGNLYDEDHFDPTRLRTGIGAGIRFADAPRATGPRLWLQTRS